MSYLIKAVSKSQWGRERKNPDAFADSCSPKPEEPAPSAPQAVLAPNKSAPRINQKINSRTFEPDLKIADSRANLMFLATLQRQN